MAALVQKHARMVRIETRWFASNTHDGSALTHEGNYFLRFSSRGKGGVLFLGCNSFAIIAQGAVVVVFVNVYLGKLQFQCKASPLTA